MEKRLLENIVREFPKKRIAVIGDIVLDKYTFGEIPKSNPEMPGAPLLRKTRDESRLGCAANVAKNIVAVGADAFLYGIVGDDKYKEEIKNLCQINRISFNPVIDKHNRTILKQRFIEEAHKHYICRIDDEDSLTVPTPEQIEQLLEKITNNSTDGIILSDYNKIVFRTNLAEKIINHARERKIPVIVDPKPENWKKFVGATVLTPNIYEARKITGMETESPEEVAKRLKEITKSEYAVITLGKDGMITYDGSFHKMPTQAREVVDVVGAGDTVTATLALSLVSGASIVEAAQIANIAAGIVVEKQGTATASVEETLNRLNN